MFEGVNAATPRRPPPLLTAAIPGSQVHGVVHHLALAMIALLRRHEA